MTISYISGTTSGNTGNNAAGSTLSISAPSGYQQGDLLIANLALEHNYDVRSVPQGWSPLPGMPLIHQFGNVHIHAFFKFADINEPNASWGWNVGNTRYSLIVDAYRGVDQENDQPWTSEVSVNNWGFNQFEVAGVSTIAEDALLIGYAAGHTSSERNIVNTNGTKTRHSMASGRAAASFSELRSNAGGTGSRTFNLDANTGGGGYLIALRPGAPVEEETAPETPTKFMITAASSSSLSLSWGDASGAGQYIIERERWTGSSEPS